MTILNSEFPVFANTRPWNELILRGVRKFKTMSFLWKYRGTIYLYDTKGKADYDFAPEWAEQNGVTISPEFGFPGCIVGTVEVVGARKYPATESGADFEVMLRNPQRMEALPYKWTTPGRISRIKAGSDSEKETQG